MTIGVDDYPFRNDACGPAGLCGGYAKRNCTDFAMWRITNDLGHPCVAGLGNALTWASRWPVRGAVDGNARVNDIAVFQPGNQGAGAQGHVAFVAATSPGRFLAEQYNYGAPVPCCCYSGPNRNPHWFSTTGVQFIHVVGAPPTCTPPCTGGAICVNGGCQCPSGTVWDGSACVPPGCSPACTGGATCINGACQCPAGTFWNGAACVPPTGGGPPGVGTMLPLLLLLGAAGVGYWEAQRHREATSAIVHDTGDFGSRHDHLTLPHLSLGAASPAPRGRVVRATSAGFG